MEKSTIAISKDLNAKINEIKERFHLEGKTSVTMSDVIEAALREALKRQNKIQIAKAISLEQLVKQLKVTDSELVTKPLTKDVYSKIKQQLDLAHQETVTVLRDEDEAILQDG